MISTRSSVPLTLAFVASACMVAPPSPQPIEGLRVRANVICPATVGCAGYSHGGSYEGTLILVDSDTLILYAKDQRARVGLPVIYIDRLEVYRGRKGSAAAAAKGAAVGAIGGALFGAVIGGATEALVGNLDGERDVGEAAGVWAAEGAVVGAIGGAAAGATSGETVWEEVTVEQLREEVCHCRLPEPAAADSIVTATAAAHRAAPSLARDGLEGSGASSGRAYRTSNRQGADRAPASLPKSIASTLPHYDTSCHHRVDATEVVVCARVLEAE